MRDLDADPIAAEHREFLFRPVARKAVKQWFKVWTLYVEWRLATATVHMNLDQGVPVPSHVLLAKAHVFVLEHDDEFPRSVQPLAQKWVQQRSQTLQFNWLCLWRQRWGFSVRAMASRNLLLAVHAPSQGSSVRHWTRNHFRPRTPTTEISVVP